MSKPDLNDRALKVLLLSPDYPPTHGGIQRLLSSITRGMPNAETRVLTLANAEAADFDAAWPQKITRVRAWGNRPVLRNGMFNLSALLNAPAWKPDIILNGHVVAGPAAVMLAKRYGIPNVLYTYGKEVTGRPGMTSWTLRHSDAGVTISEFTRGLMVEACGGSLPAPVSIVFPGVEVPADTGNMSAPRPTIVTTARLRDWYKGHDKMIDAMPAVLQAVPDAQWIVIGDGRLRPQLETRAQELGLGDSVRFLGSVDDAERDHWLSIAHVFAMPARLPKDEVGGEGFAVVFLEAAALGLPSVAPNVAGPREAVVDGETGLWVDPEDSSDIARALIRLLSDPAYGAKLGAQGRERVERSFRWETVGADLEAMLRAVVQQRQPG